MRFVFTLALLAAMAQAQEDRTFRFRNAATDQDFQDIATAAVTASGLKAKSIDAGLRELTMSGPAEQIRVAEWVIAELDRPASSTPPPASNILTLTTKEPDNSVRVFYPTKITSDQDFAEVATGILTISDLRYVARYTSRRALVVRANREGIDVVEWLLTEINNDSPQQTYVFPKTGPDVQRGENYVRLFRFPRAKDAQQFNEAQTMIRTLTDTRRVYPYISKRVIFLRGTEEQIDMSRWVLAQIDKELPLAQKTNSSDYTTKAGDVMRMFYFSAAMPLQTFQETQTAIRKATGIRRTYPYASARTLAMRGTAAEIAQAAALAAQ